LKSKFILSALFLTTAISCSSYKPFVLSEAYISVKSRTTNITQDQLNFQRALFNQYASGLDFTIRLEYSNFYTNNVNLGLVYLPSAGSSIAFNQWDIVTGTFAEANLTGIWKQRFIEVLFGRNFDAVTKLPSTYPTMYARKWNLDSVNWIFKIKSKVNYNLNIGGVYLNYGSGINASINEFYIFMDFFNSNNQLLNRVLLDTDRSGSSTFYDIGNVVTDVNRFDLYFQMVDTPPFAGSVSDIYFNEYNLFTQGSDIKIPNDVGGDRFGFTFVAVEWWDILGHLQNFAWWIVNKSPISPIFVWIDTYIITWISGLITFVTGVFNL